MSSWTFPPLLLLSLAATFLTPCHSDDSSDTFSPLGAETTAMTTLEAAQSIISRITPSLSSNFTLSLSPPPSNSNKDYYEITTIDTYTIKIEANDGVSLASGYNHYLQNYLNSSISWTGDNLDSVVELESMPPVDDQGIHKSRFLPWSYYLNVCTHSYSTVWWDWTRWQREIDWMAMRGVNMPLMVTGQEYVWIRTFEQFGLSFEDLGDFFSGPAFLAWQRMGNIQGWAGPLPTDWIEVQFELGKKIFQYMRELGMKPVLPAFAGHVPEKFIELFPDADVIDSEPWADIIQPWCCAKFLEPTDPLYGDISEAFITNLIKYYGPNDHLYNGDQFNEIIPARVDPEYLKGVAMKTIASMKKADPEAIWVLQGWVFVFGGDATIWHEPQIRGYLSGVDNDSMIILDVWAEREPVWNRTKNYFGKPFIWCQLLNFGGQPGMGGDMEVTMNTPFETAALENNPMVGVGITMEGIFHNAVMFDLLLDQAWMTGPVKVQTWLEAFVRARYGSSNKHAHEAWDTLRKTVYSRNDRIWFHRIVRETSTAFHNGISEPDQVLPALRQLVRAGPELKDVATYRYDVVDLSRQYLSELFEVGHTIQVLAFESRYLYQIKYINDKAQGLLADLEDILASHEDFLLGTWLRDARKWAQTPEQGKLFTFNAINQITQWGPRKSILEDYAAKQWSGLIGDYYAQRWRLFGDYLQHVVECGEKYDQEVLNSAKYNFTWKWQDGELDYPTEPTGDTIEIANYLVAKYETFVWPGPDNERYKPSASSTSSKGSSASLQSLIGCLFAILCGITLIF